METASNLKCDEDKQRIYSQSILRKENDLERQNQQLFIKRTFRSHFLHPFEQYEDKDRSIYDVEDYDEILIHIYIIDSKRAIMSVGIGFEMTTTWISLEDLSQSPLFDHFKHDVEIYVRGQELLSNIDSIKQTKGLLKGLSRLKNQFHHYYQIEMNF